MKILKDTLIVFCVVWAVVISIAMCVIASHE